MREVLKTMLPAKSIVTAFLAVGLNSICLNSIEAQTTPSAINSPAAPARPKGSRVLHLRVVAADTGEPVPKADVRVWIAMKDEWRKTDDQGRIDIVHATGPADRTVVVDVWGPGRAMQRHNWGHGSANPVPESATIKLQKGETLSGFVQDEHGNPVRGATVYLFSHNFKRKDPHELIYDLRATTCPDGRWSTSGAPETTGELLGFRVEHPDFLNNRGYAEMSLPKIADLREGKAVVVPKRGIPIEGRVTDDKARPIAGATVASSPMRDHVMYDQTPATTDAEGRFRTRQVAPGSGEWFVTVRVKGHAPEVKEVKVAEESPWVEIAVGPPRVFRGRVVDPDGKPVSGVFIGVDGFGRYGGLDEFLYSDAEGRFRWDDAPNEPLRLNVLNEGYLDLIGKSVEPSGAEIVLKIFPAVQVQGTVRDPGTKKRVPKAVIQFGPVDLKSGDVVKWSAPPPIGSVMYDRGDFNLAIPVVDDADTYKFRILADGYAPFVSRAFRRDEKLVVDYDVSLVPAKE